MVQLRFLVPAIIITAATLFVLNWLVQSKPATLLQTTNSVTPAKVQPPKVANRLYIEPVSPGRILSGPWTEADPATATEIPTAWEETRDARLLSLDRSNMQKAVSDGELEIHIPQLASDFTVRVEQVEKRSSGTVSIQGHINGDRRFGFVLTLGSNSTFATIGTPQGVFNLAGNADLAWIVAQRELDRQIDPDKPDYVVLRPEVAEQ